MINYQEIDAFFVSYNNFKKEINSKYISRTLNEIKSFIHDFDSFTQSVSNLKSTESPFYNIFDILNVKHRETKLHTPFLIHLLNPKASHEQGAIFLDAFFEHVLNLDIRYDEVDRFEIHEELSSDQGRMDIIMFFTIDGIKKSW